MQILYIFIFYISILIIKNKTGFTIIKNKILYKHILKLYYLNQEYFIKYIKCKYILMQVPMQYAS